MQHWGENSARSIPRSERVIEWTVVTCSVALTATQLHGLWVSVTGLFR